MPNSRWRAPHRVRTVHDRAQHPRPCCLDASPMVQMNTHADATAGYQHLGRGQRCRSTLSATSSLSASCRRPWSSSTAARSKRASGLRASTLIASCKGTQKLPLQKLQKLKTIYVFYIDIFPTDSSRSCRKLPVAAPDCRNVATLLSGMDQPSTTCKRCEATPHRLAAARSAGRAGSSRRDRQQQGCPGLRKSSAHLQALQRLGVAALPVERHARVAVQHGGAPVDGRRPRGSGGAPPPTSPAAGRSARCRTCGAAVPLLTS